MAFGFLLASAIVCFARVLYLILGAVGFYLLVDATVPEYNKPWGMWIVLLAMVGPYYIGFCILNTEEKISNDGGCGK